MNPISRSAIIGAIVAMAIGAPVSGEPRVALTVRLYNSAGIPAQGFLAASRAIESTFQDTGVKLIVRHCGTVDNSIDPCGESLKPLEIVVRIIDAPPSNPNLHPDACGVAYVLPETDRGWLATAFADRIAGAAIRVGVDAGTLLGLVIAHEVGHLLLGRGYHGWTGLMRADWEEQLLKRNPEAWRFSTLEAARLRRAAEVPF